MDIEELNQALLYKMAEEQGQYRDWLLGQPSKEILNHAYEDVCCKGEFQNP